MRSISIRHCGLLFGCLCAISIFLLMSCTFRKVPGGFEVFPGVGDDPSTGGFYQEVEINGQCYLSNGTWCIPCGGGGRFKCEEILRHPTPKDDDDDDQDDELELGLGFGDAGEAQDGVDGGSLPATDMGEASIVATPPLNLAGLFYNLTNGLDGESFAIVNGLLGWQPGEIVALPLIVNIFSDDEDILDVSFIWRTNWKQPQEDLPPDIELWVFIDGDFEDENPETMLIKLAGPIAAVEQVLSQMGTDPVVYLANGWSYP